MLERVMLTSFYLQSSVKLTSFSVFYANNSVNITLDTVSLSVELLLGCYKVLISKSKLVLIPFEDHV